MNPINNPMHIELGQFLVLANKHISPKSVDDKADTVRLAYSSNDYSVAKERANNLANDGYGCIIIDCYGGYKVYEVNQWLLKSKSNIMNDVNGNLPEPVIPSSI